MATIYNDIPLRNKRTLDVLKFPWGPYHYQAFVLTTAIQSLSGYRETIYLLVKKIQIYFCDIYIYHKYQ